MFKIDKRTFWIFMGTNRCIRIALALVITLIFTIFLYPSLTVVAPEYRPGDIATRNIKAPVDFFIEDSAATEANRKLAIESALAVFDLDEELLPLTIEKINASFAMGAAIFKNSSDPAQSGEALQEQPNYEQAALEKKPEFERILGIEVSDATYEAFVKSGFSKEAANAAINILAELLKTGVISNQEYIKSQTEKSLILINLKTGVEKIIDPPQKFYWPEKAKEMITSIGHSYLKEIPASSANAVIEMTLKLISPNITPNRSESEKRIKDAADSVKPVLYQIKTGEMLLREGERVSPDHIMKLRTLQDQTKRENMLSNSVGTGLTIIIMFLIFYRLHIPKTEAESRQHNKTLLFMATILLSFLILAKLFLSWSSYFTGAAYFSMDSAAIYFGLPMAAGPMIVCLFFGLSNALPFALVLSLLSSIIFSNNMEIFIFYLLSGAMGAFWVRDCRERKVFIKAALKLGLLNMLLAAATSMHIAFLSPQKLLISLAAGFSGGFLAGIATSGIVPLIEVAFNYTTDIKLLELANPDQPILRKLMLEAPGTYNHSMIVGTLAEAAASEIDANPLLARVGGYYHDIGKINKPFYFIENIRNMKNKHDKLAPSMSALILTSHVKDGANLSKKYKLGKAITDIIRQHHGTSLIRYFYDKARQIKGDDAVNPNDFRYQGPSPQTKEAAIVMLADVVEAASRTLENPTQARLQGLILNLINKIFADHQLDGCDLTLKDLHRIAKSFTKILTGIYHSRIEYSEPAAPSSEGKQKNDGTDRQPPDKPSNPDGSDGDQGSGHLKRLGLS
ncbi:HD family phosphohydrolase [Desulforegula conservatrix]|uniref:HD family phosphohydrolase n=1 Tax=Desulforegula conservatrix TaxID=153026 RepID=UPI000409F2D9|nr:HDIG domain-containing metalloprotein [Desulforegula conservatrix]